MRAIPLRHLACVGNNNKQDRQFIVIVFTICCTLHRATLCNRSLKDSFFPFKDPPAFYPLFAHHIAESVHFGVAIEWQPCKPLQPPMPHDFFPTP